jgi:TetR/AcrR family transcriptional repressor of nem operon
MRVTREQMAEHRRKILAAASRLFREKGFDQVTVAEVMQAAGLTHGGFYGHFKSKDELIAETLAVVLDGATTKSDLADYAAWYLSPRHRDDRAGGCPIAGLGAETLRQSKAARGAMTVGLKRHVDRLAKSAPGKTPAEKRRAAIAGWSAMVGALVLARISEDARFSDEVLAETRAAIGPSKPKLRS